VIVGLTATATLGAFQTSIASSAVHRSAASVDTALRSFASATTYQVQLQPSAEFADCQSTPYRVASAYPSNASSGSTIMVFATGFANGRSVSVKIGPTATSLVNVTSDVTAGGVVANGAVAAQLSVPSGLTLGSNLLVVSDGTSTATGALTVTSGAASTTNLGGYSISMTSITYWNGSAFDTACTQGANQPQLVTISASTPGGIAGTLSFVVMNPSFVSSTWPTFTTAATASFVVGQAGSFTVHASGSPTPNYAESGSLPAGVSFVDNHNGNATISGTPAAGTSGTYVVMLTAANGTLPNASQTFTLSVNGPPSFTSAASTTFSIGNAGSFSVTTAGVPTAAITEVGALPTGVSLVDNGNGTATLSGTPAAGSSKSYTITLTANNGVSPNATQTFTLTVDCPPTITSASSANFRLGSADSFTITTAAATYPTALISESGTLPSGVTFRNNGDGTATISGTPAAGSSGTYAITLTASNGAAPPATQSFSLVVGSPPVFTGGGTTCSGKAKQALNCTLITTSGYPVASFTLSGSPPGWVSLTPNGTGGVQVTGTPPNKTSGTFTFTIVATNAFGTTSETYTVTVA